MPARVLVAYVSRYGSTQEVAEAVAQVLREAGCEAEASPINAVGDVADYDAFVVGAPLYMFHWHRKARRFIARHRRVLRERPTAVFAMGPLNDEPEEWQSAEEQFQKALLKYEWFSPVATTVFGGAFDPVKLTFPHTIIRPLTRMPASDIRDWNTIRGWAADLVPVLTGNGGPG